MLGGLFTTPDCMHAEIQWMDFYFLSGRRNLFFNATARTAGYAFSERVSSLATERSLELVPYIDDPRTWMTCLRIGSSPTIFSTLMNGLWMPPAASRSPRPTFRDKPQGILHDERDQGSDARAFALHGSIALRFGLTGGLF